MVAEAQRAQAEAEGRIGALEAQEARQRAGREEAEAQLGETLTALRVAREGAERDKAELAQRLSVQVCMRMHMDARTMPARIRIHVHMLAHACARIRTCHAAELLRMRARTQESCSLLACLLTYLLT